LYEV